MQKISIGRLIGLLIAIVAIGVSFWCARDALRMNAEFHDWLQARPMATAIDLSRPGETTTAFHQTCSISHGEALYLQCDLDDEAKLNSRGVFHGLSGIAVIEDSGGKEVETLRIDHEAVQYWDGKIILAGFAPFPKGDYVARIRVDSGAPDLAGKQQLLYAEYQLCGLEQMPALVAAAFAFGAGILGLVAAVCILPGLLRCGIWRHDAKDEG